MTPPRDIPPPPRPGEHPSDLSSREDPYHVTQASRIFLLPNLMTAGNLACGFISILCCIRANYEIKLVGATMLSDLPPGAIAQFKWAVWLIFGAGAFDLLDGRLARMGGRESLFGVEFDSLADVISFGVAPALLVFFLILSPTQGYPVFQQIGGFLSFIYLLCAAIRLARFNVITNPLLHRDAKESHKDFVGLPAPVAAAAVAAIVLALLDLADRGRGASIWRPALLDLAETDRGVSVWALGLPPLMVLIAVLMISSVRYPSGKQLDLQTRLKLRSFFLLVIVAGLILLFKEFGLLVIGLAYIFYGLFRHWRRGRKRQAHAK